MNLDVLEIQDQQRQAIVRSDTIKFCHAMIQEGIEKQDIPQIRIYFELLKKYSN